MHTKMTLETEEGIFSIEKDVGCDGSLPELIEDVIVPILLAAGYAQQTIEEQFAGGWRAP